MCHFTHLFTIYLTNLFLLIEKILCGFHRYGRNAQANVQTSPNVDEISRRVPRLSDRLS